MIVPSDFEDRCGCFKYSTSGYPHSHVEPLSNQLRQCYCKSFIIQTCPLPHPLSKAGDGRWGVKKLGDGSWDPPVPSPTYVCILIYNFYLFTWHVPPLTPCQTQTCIFYHLYVLQYLSVLHKQSTTIFKNIYLLRHPVDWRSQDVDMF